MTDSATVANHASNRFGSYKIAVLVPCYNEEATVAKVVEDFRIALPAATIFVFDNNSTDKTAQVARAAGAEVRPGERTGARASSCGACSPTWKPTSTCLWMAMQLTMRRVHGA